MDGVAGVSASSCWRSVVACWGACRYNMGNVSAHEAQYAGAVKPFFFFSSHLFSRVGLVGAVLLGSFQAAPDVQGDRAKSKPLRLFVASNLANSFMPVSRHGPFISRQLRLRMKAARGKRWLRPAPRW